MPRLAPRFYCRARLGVTARHRAGLAGPGSESVASSEIPAVLPLAHGNEERDSRHQAVGTCQSPGPRMLTSCGPACLCLRFGSRIRFTPLAVFFCQCLVL